MFLLFYIFLDVREPYLPRYRQTDAVSHLCLYVRVYLYLFFFLNYIFRRRFNILVEEIFFRFGSCFSSLSVNLGHFILALEAIFSDFFFLLTSNLFLNENWL